MTSTRSLRCHWTAMVGVVFCLFGCQDESSKPSTSPAPNVDICGFKALEFESLKALQQWGEESAFGGGIVHELEYHGTSVVVAARMHTSGLLTSEPFVFVEKKGRWRLVLHASLEYWGCEPSIEKDFLVLRKVMPYGDAGNSSAPEWIRYDLSALEDA